MHSIKASVIQSYIRDNCPNATLVSWNDPDCDLEFYTAEQLQTVSKDWFPLCCYRSEDSQQVVYGGRNNVVHTYTEGETGAGKTSRFAMQSIRALSCLQDKPSFVIVDIHGELIENLYSHLTANGYQVKVLNCDDPEHSDTYNPLAPLVKRCLESGRIDDEVINGIRKIAEIMQPVETNQDPIWEQGARSYTNGCILDKFEDLIRGNIPPQSVTLYNIIQNHYWLRDKIVGNPGDILSIPHYKTKGADALSVQKMMSVTNNAERTRASYFGVVENHYDAFGQPSLYRLSSNSTIDIDDFIDRPTAIFIQSGSTRIGDHLISLLVNEIYTTAVIRGKTIANKMLPRKIHCFLDEFANSNIADGPEFIKMLTTSRKFGMYWHLLLQCDAQLDTKFDTDTARIIRANCTEIFMGSNEHETMVRFAKSCGQKTVESLGSLVNQETPVLETVDLMTVDKLSLTEYGHVYIKGNRRPLLHSYMEAFYRCPEFVPVADIRSVYPDNTFDYTKTTFFPEDVLPELSSLECRILQHLSTTERESISNIKKKFPASPIDIHIDQLKRKELIHATPQYIRSQLNEGQYALLQLRQSRQDEDQPLPQEDSQGSAAAYFASNSMIDLKDALPHLSCIPEELAVKLRIKGLGGSLSAEDKKHLLSPVFRFEIAEAFIANNDFQEKSQWVAQFQKELEIIQSIAQLPEPVKAAFVAALNQIQDLSIENIREIKRIVS
jgi:hypothetical protein